MIAGMIPIDILARQGRRPNFVVTLDDDYVGRQTEHERLRDAISTTPGAQLGELWTEAHSELSSRDQYLLAITPSNEF